jgi:hypothetical protein
MWCSKGGRRLQRRGGVSRRKRRGPILLKIGLELRSVQSCEMMMKEKNEEGHQTSKSSSGLNHVRSKRVREVQPLQQAQEEQELEGGETV